LNLACHRQGEIGVRALAPSLARRAQHARKWAESDRIRRRRPRAHYSGRNRAQTQIDARADCES
jgi:hypothetical protein